MAGLAPDEWVRLNAILLSEDGRAAASLHKNYGPHERAIPKQYGDEWCVSWGGAGMCASEAAVRAKATAINAALDNLRKAVWLV